MSALFVRQTGIVPGSKFRDRSPENKPGGRFRRTPGQRMIVSKADPAENFSLLLKSSAEGAKPPMKNSPDRSGPDFRNLLIRAIAEERCVESESISLHSHGNGSSLSFSITFKTSSTRFLSFGFFDRFQVLQRSFRSVLSSSTIAFRSNSD